MFALHSSVERSNSAFAGSMLFNSDPLIGVIIKQKAASCHLENASGFIKI